MSRTSLPRRIASRVELTMMPAITGTRPLAASTVAANEVAIFLVVERVALAGRAARRHAMAAGADQPVDLRCNELEIDSPSFRERRRHRRYHAGRSHFHGAGPRCFHPLHSGCVRFAGISAGRRKPTGCRHGVPVAELARQGGGTAAPVPRLIWSNTAFVAFADGGPASRACVAARRARHIIGGYLLWDIGGQIACVTICLVSAGVT